MTCRLDTEKKGETRKERGGRKKTGKDGEISPTHGHSGYCDNPTYQGKGYRSEKKEGGRKRRSWGTGRREKI